MSPVGSWAHSEKATSCFWTIRCPSDCTNFRTNIVFTKEVQDSWVWNVPFSHFFRLCRLCLTVDSAPTIFWYWEREPELACAYGIWLRKQDLNANLERQRWWWLFSEGSRAHFPHVIVLIIFYSPDPFLYPSLPVLCWPLQGISPGPPPAILTLCLVDGEHQVRKWERRNLVSAGAALHSLFLDLAAFPSVLLGQGCCSQLVSGHLIHSPLLACWTFTSWKQTFVKSLFIWYKWEWILFPIR